ncbi:MmgE/PrpD family protein [Haloarcula amylovorans]|uniref:MmgE/PrpD family protein n=1 Tax=Haloarcula amylovorans TaxID=2562280 RepID=UPI0010764BAF|nr:MmgE/PrpD family protein [Halomicroarcula amylolytica]
MSTAQAVRFVQSATVSDTPSVERHVKARVLDTLAAITAGYRQDGVDIVRDYARSRLGGDEATLLDGSGTTLTTEGATLANGIAANALDIDDGHREVKGHPAAVVVPPALAVADAVEASIPEFLDAVFVGYELAVRAGLAIHALDDVYTGTGSWGAVGAAAATARLCEFSAQQTIHALSVAEYHAPRTPIMRGVEKPGMTKDGIGWGAYAGVVGAQLAQDGFTGAGTVFDDSDVTETLGAQFHVTDGYFKPYPCCRWAQPGIDAVSTLMSQHDIDSSNIESVRISTFEEATHLRTRNPSTPEEAQYSYPYPVAATLVRGRFTQAEHAEEARTDTEIRALADRVEFTVDETLDARFPSECLARVDIKTDDKTYQSDVTRASGSRDSALSSAELREKTRQLVSPTLPPGAIKTIDKALDTDQPTSALLEPWSM